MDRQKLSLVGSSNILYKSYNNEISSINVLESTNTNDDQNIVEDESYILSTKESPIAFKIFVPEIDHSGTDRIYSKNLEVYLKSYNTDDVVNDVDISWVLSKDDPDNFTTIDNLNALASGKIYCLISQDDGVYPELFIHDLDIPDEEQHIYLYCWSDTSYHIMNYCESFIEYPDVTPIIETRALGRTAYYSSAASRQYANSSANWMGAETQNGVTFVKYGGISSGNDWRARVIWSKSSFPTSAGYDINAAVLNWYQSYYSYSGSATPVGTTIRVGTMSKITTDKTDLSNQKTSYYHGAIDKDGQLHNLAFEAGARYFQTGAANCCLYQSSNTSNSNRYREIRVNSNYNNRPNIALGYTAKTYTVSYNANGGKGAPASQTKTYDVTLKLSTTKPTRSSTSSNFTITGNGNGGTSKYATAKKTTSYSFSSWNTNSSGTGTNYSSGGNYTANAAVTLYAKWSSSNSYSNNTIAALGTTTRANASAGSYKVTFNANGGSCSTTSLTAARTTKYTFKGWGSSSTSTTVLSSSTAYTSVKTVYAVWNSSTTTASITLPTATRGNSTHTGYKVTFNGNGGNPSVASLTSKLTRSYTFKGWSTSSSATSGSTGSYTPTGNQTLYAAWTYTTTNGSITLPTATRSNSTITGYTVTLNPQGGTVSSTSLTSTRTNSYKFNGWSTNSSASSGSTGSYTPTAATTMYATWKTTTTNNAITLPTPTRTGYTFKGWATSAAATSGVTGSYTPSSNVTLYAIWDANTYKLSIKNNIENETPNIPAPSSIGTVTGAGSYDFGSQVTVSYTPAKYFKFDHWENNGSTSSSATYKFTLSKAANYALNLYVRYEPPVVMIGGKPYAIYVYSNGSWTYCAPNVYSNGKWSESASYTDYQ